MSQAELPLYGTTVVDVSRMLPGGVLARQLLDLGARLIKIEEPGVGDPMRMVPPIVDGIGVGFSALLGGAESVCLDLTRDEGQGHLRALAARADVLVESFRPGTMESWGIGFDELAADNPRLVWCSLSSFGRHQAVRHRLAHDLNLIALTGALEAMGPTQPRLQLADVGAGLLAATSILAALLRRERSGTGGRLEQPLITGPAPFMTWRWAEAAAAREEVVELLLGGACPCYRTYRCGDGKLLAVAALEPKFWLGFVTMLGADELDSAGFAMGDEGTSAAARIEELLEAHPRSHWLELAERRGLPLSAVNDVGSALHEPVVADVANDAWLPSVGRRPAPSAPGLGEHTEAVLSLLG